VEKQKKGRENPCFKCQEPVDILGGKPLKFFSALMLNFSASGLHIELSRPLQAGEMIVIKPGEKAILSPVSFGPRGQRLAKVRRCMEAGAENTRRYRCDAQYM
jgi:hypothetical protein